MRVITVRQPWAWAIVRGGKDVENRTRNIAGSYRGPVAIHAGLRYDHEATQPVRDMVGYTRFPDLPHTWNRSRWALGAIIGVVELVDVHEPDAFPDGRPFCWPDGWVTGTMCSPWAMDGHRHLELANPRAVAPIPAKGKLGLWRPDAELLAQIEAAL